MLNKVSSSELTLWVASYAVEFEDSEKLNTDANGMPLGSTVHPDSEIEEWL